MTIKEMEELLDMPRANIRYYEQQGLLSPVRAENGYREYSTEDLQTLERIRLLRGLGVSIEEIRDIRAGRVSMRETLSQKAGAYRRSKSEIETANEICEALRKEGADFDTLDAKKYASGAWRAQAKPVAAPLESLSYKAYPWRRFFARMLDLSLCTAVWEILLAVALRVNLTALSGRVGWRILDTAAAFLLMLLLEPVFLRFFGATPGKWIFGIRVAGYKGERLSIREGRSRAWSAIWSGLGACIPIYSWVRLWKSYRITTDGQDTPWESESLLTVSDTKAWRGIAYAFAYAVPVAMLLLAINLSMLPPHASVKSVADFADNYNHYAEYYEIGSARLTETGEWTTEETPGNGVVIALSSLLDMPKFTYRLENGELAEVEFRIEQRKADKNDLSPEALMAMIPLNSLSMQAQISVLSFLGAGYSPLSNGRWTILQAANPGDFVYFTWEGDGGSMEMDVEYEGYDSTPGALFAREGERTAFSAVFTMRTAK